MKIYFIYNYCNWIYTHGCEMTPQAFPGTKKDTKPMKASREWINSQNTNLCQEGSRSAFPILKKRRHLAGVLITCLSHSPLRSNYFLILPSSTSACFLSLKHSSARNKSAFKIPSGSFFSKLKPCSVGLKTFQNLTALLVFNLSLVSLLSQLHPHMMLYDFQDSSVCSHLYLSLHCHPIISSCTAHTNLMSPCQRWPN